VASKHPNQEVVRHANAVSNIIGPAEQLDPEAFTLPELKALTTAAQRSDEISTDIRHGEYLPDGLLWLGVQQIQDFVNSVTDNGKRRIDNVYMMA
jgi:hypothetical protein